MISDERFQRSYEKLSALLIQMSTRSRDKIIQQAMQTLPCLEERRYETLSFRKCFKPCSTPIETASFIAW